MHHAQADTILQPLFVAAAPNSLQQGLNTRNGNTAFGAAAQQTAQKQVRQGSATHSSRSQNSKAVTVSSEASAIDITGEVHALQASYFKIMGTEPCV